MARQINRIVDTPSKLKSMETRNYPVVKANDLIQKTRYDLSLQEQKLVLHLIQLITPDDKEFTEYQFSIQDYCKICEIDYKNGKNYQNIKKSLKALSDKSFWVEIDNKEVLMRWVHEIEIDKSSGIIEVQLHEKLKPYLLQLKQFFTKYNYLYVMSMRSQYSIRLYEILKSYENVRGIIYEIDELRKVLGMSKNILPRWVDLKRFVIEQAIKEINELTDILVRYDTIKKGRSVFEVVFHISSKDEKSKVMAQWKIEKRLNKKKKFDDSVPY
jgi:plasmid replication initiation protein